MPCSMHEPLLNVRSEGGIQEAFVRERKEKKGLGKELCSAGTEEDSCLK